ncbi:MAG: hypothetical protein J6033_01920 [Lachnospiraceae bacterium]|nr:hypothetical protein [Lachnospiraceae bacterium]
MFKDKEHKKTVLILFILILSYGSVAAAGHLSKVIGATAVYNGVTSFGMNLTAWVMYVATCVMLYRMTGRSDRRLHVVSLALGLFVSTGCVWGTYAHFKNDIFTDASTILTQIGVILGLSLFSVTLCEELFLIAERFRDIMAGEEIREKSLRRFLTAWGIIFAFWFPVFLAFWPGNFVVDSAYQLQNVIEGYHFTHHPLAHTLLMGAAYNFGRSIGNASAGAQIYTLIQMLVLSASCAYAVTYIYRKGFSRWIDRGAVVWFALFPMHPIMAITATKDILFAAFFMAFFIYVIRYFYDKEKFRVPQIIGMTVTGAGAMLYRNNGLYAIAVGMVILAIFQKTWKAKGKALLLLLAALLLYSGINNALIHQVNATKSDSNRESMSIPLQCMARVVAYRPGEMKEEYYEELLSYVSVEAMKTYNPYNADSVKGEANEALLGTNKLNFLKLWIKIGLQFPGEYIEEIVTNTMGYWFPLGRGMYAEMDIRLYHILIGMGDEIEKKGLCPPVNAVYSPLFYSGEYENTPLLGYAYRSDGYIWLAVLLICFAIIRKKYGILAVMLIPALYLGTCFLGPLAALRYVYSLIVLLPLQICLLVDSKKEKVGQ